MRRRRGVCAQKKKKKKKRQDKLCVCFPLEAHECRLRWFTSTGDCSDCSAPCQCPGSNLGVGVNEKC